MKWLPVWIGGGTAVLSGGVLLAMILREGAGGPTGDPQIGAGILALLFLMSAGLTVVYLLLVVVLADLKKFFGRHNRSN